MTDAPDPYLTAGWTSQHQHRTRAEPPHLEPRPAAPQEDDQAEDTQGKRKSRKRT